MTRMEWWIHDQRLIAHYEHEAAHANFVAAIMFALMGILFLLCMFLACSGIAVWWIAIIPALVCMFVGFIAMLDAMSAKEMIEHIKWRM